MQPPRTVHAWDVPPKEAVEIQRRLRPLVITKGDLRHTRYVAGADISWDRPSGMGFAAVIVFTFPELQQVEVTQAFGPAPFPYVPGLLSFREGPLLLEAFAALHTRPDVVLFDGHGLAHPRRMGIATHLGLLLDVPAIGCGKSRLVGQHGEPALRRGSRCRLMDHGECIGSVVRTCDAVRPIYVSIGHRTSLAEAIRFTLRCSDGYRIPKPTRIADHLVGKLRRAQAPGPLR